MNNIVLLAVIARVLIMVTPQRMTSKTKRIAPSDNDDLKGTPQIRFTSVAAREHQYIIHQEQSECDCDRTLIHIRYEQLAIQSWFVEFNILQKTCADGTPSNDNSNPFVSSTCGR